MRPQGSKADRAVVVRQALEAAGVEVHETSRMAADIPREDGVSRFNWSISAPIDASVSVYRQVMTKSIAFVTARRRMVQGRCFGGQMADGAARCT